MVLTPVMVLVLVAVTACTSKKSSEQENSCADYPNDICPTADANQQKASTINATENQQKASTTSETENQQTETGSAASGSSAKLAGSAMRERIATSFDFSVLDETGSTLLHWAAAREKNTETLKFLLAQGVIDINKQNDGGNTALHVAVRYGDYGGVQLLLNQPDINKSLKNKSDSTAYDIAVGLKRTLIAALLAP